MNRVTQIKVGLFAIGIVIWGYGYATDDSNIRWIGIGFLAASLLLRFLPKRTDDTNSPS
jgi:hypothetical protein